MHPVPQSEDDIIEVDDGSEPPQSKQATHRLTPQLLLSCALLFLSQTLSHVLVGSPSRPLFSNRTTSAMAVVEEALKAIVSLVLFFISAKQFSHESRPLSASTIASYVVLAVIGAVNTKLAYWIHSTLGFDELIFEISLLPLIVGALLWALYDHRLNRLQWISLALCFFGLSHISTTQPEIIPSSQLKRTFIRLFVACLLSSFYSVINAHILQTNAHTSLHYQNALLCSLTTIANLVAHHARHHKAQVGFFFEFEHHNVWIAILCHGLVGIATTIAFRHGGAVVTVLVAASQRGFVTVIDIAFFGGTWSSLSLSGAIVPMLATYIYLFYATHATPTVLAMPITHANDVISLLEECILV